MHIHSWCEYKVIAYYKYVFTQEIEEMILINKERYNAPIFNF